MAFQQTLPLCNLKATSAPSSSDNYDKGWEAGSLWVFGLLIFQCTGDGIWQTIGGSSFSEITNTTTQTALKNNSNWVNPASLSDKFYDKYTGAVIIGQNVGNYYIGVDSVTGLKYYYEVVEIAGTQSIIRISLAPTTKAYSKSNIIWDGRASGIYITPNGLGNPDAFGFLIDDYGIIQYPSVTINPDGTNVSWQITGGYVNGTVLRSFLIDPVSLTINGGAGGSSSQTLAQILAVSENAANHTIINLADPVNPQDVATKSYVDNSVPAISSTDVIPEGSSNFYFNSQRVREVVLTGLSFLTSTAIAATDTVLTAFGKLQAQITAETKRFEFDLSFQYGTEVMQNYPAASTISSVVLGTGLTSVNVIVNGGTPVNAVTATPISIPAGANVLWRCIYSGNVAQGSANVNGTKN